MIYSLSVLNILQKLKENMVIESIET